MQINDKLNWPYRDRVENIWSEHYELQRIPVEYLNAIRFMNSIRHMCLALSIL